MLGHLATPEYLHAQAVDLGIVPATRSDGATSTFDDLLEAAARGDSPALALLERAGLAKDAIRVSRETPNLSTSRPAGNCTRQYDQVNAESTTPSCWRSRPNSSAIEEPATEIAVRSRKLTTMPPASSPPIAQRVRPRGSTSVRSLSW